ncbi:hypothetical protein A3A66_02215 [Microgenomates group bacterium RIFCSPLOWO2_01_FULL_46_13]|nr:MAG: hypothetical protein A2783_01985 [Microgenomates group bacterium RIFCSPHIGHO2_01_FULL_45_11]OGV94791.1 MAG: hypothetical protein A3A66_02215 [Microgenomates group bacterium RIFCSPLOWO2_01_FULL_46_13]
MNKTRPQPTTTKGQTLIEVIFAATITAVVLVAVVHSLSLSIKASRKSSDQTLSTRYAQEGVEWFRQQRDRVGWFAFTTWLPVGMTTYCTPTLPDLNGPSFSPFTAGVCSGSQYIPGTNFERFLTITPVNQDANPDPEAVDIIVTVEWWEGTQQFQSRLTSSLEEWNPL